MDVKRIKFLMDIDESIDKLAKDFPKEPTVNKLQHKFYDLANRQFIKSAYQGLHELTIDDIIKKQASEFYKNFPESIKNELIEGFIEMEHQRRRDNYWAFCSQIFKQFECYINFLFKNEIFLLVIIDKWWDKSFIYSNLKWDAETKTYSILEVKYGNTKYYEFLGFRKSGDYSFKYIDYENYFKNPSYLVKDDLNRFKTFQSKFKIILFVSFFDEKVNEDKFRAILDLFYEIQQARNYIHGGKESDLSQKQKDSKSLDKQEEILVKSFENRYNNYLKYQGFLADFMQKVSNSPNLNLA